MPRRVLSICALGLLLGACASEQEQDHHVPSDDLGAPDLSQRVSNDLTLRFQARVGTQAFACGQQYPGVGSGAGATIAPEDFRLYLHDIRLVDSSGVEVPVALIGDQKWQYQNTVLLDFEDKTGPCGGTTPTNVQVIGKVPDGSKTWTGVRFKVGVPFALNHADPATAPSPLNLTSLFWTWQSGYKFVRIEGQNSTGKTFIVHLGSTGCMKDGSGNVTACQNPNRPEIALDGFDPKKNSIAVDLAALLTGTDMSADVECMSGPGSADCPAIFSRLGLSYGGAPAGTSQFFRVE